MENSLRFKLGTIKGSEIANNRDSDSPSRILNAEISSQNDIQTVELINGQGEDFNPEDENVVLVIPLGDAFKMGILVDDGVEPDNSLDKGEKELYSYESGSKKATIRLKLNEEIVLNNGVDFAVKFNELKTQIDALRVALNAHTHTGVTSGGQTSGIPSLPFTVNVDNTKVEKVRL